MHFKVGLSADGLRFYIKNRRYAADVPVRKMTAAVRDYVAWHATFERQRAARIAREGGREDLAAAILEEAR